MTKVKIQPGVCGLTALVTAEYDDDEEEVKVKVVSGCKAIQQMMENLGDTFDPMEICLVRPGQNAIYKEAGAGSYFPVHASCPVMAGIVKCIEVEAGLALKKDASIEFID